MLEAKRKGINIKDEKDRSENYKVCTQCKTKNPEKAIFCVNCGIKLEKNLIIKCPSCGTENTVVAKFCVGCGEKLNQKTDDTKPSTFKPKIQSTENLIVDDVEFPESKNESESINKTQETGSKPEKPIIPSNVPENDQILKKDTKKLCPSCNGKNLENAKFCVVCGKNFEKENTTSDLTKEEDLKVQATTPEIKVPNDILYISKKYENPEESNQKSESVSNKDTYIDPVEKIKKSKELLDMGAITSEEFENIKKKYLEKI